MDQLAGCRTLITGSPRSGSAANRANAAKSTGPRTAEGKARSARNARKHGFTASAFDVASPEDLQEIANFMKDLVALHRPVNPLELSALEPIALAQHALRRAARLESGLFTTCLDESCDPLGDPVALRNEEIGGNGDAQVPRARNYNSLLGEGFCRTARRTKCRPLLLRYKTQAERDYRRAVEDLNRLKAQRRKSPNEPIMESQPQQNETTCTSGETASFPSGAPSPGSFSEPVLDPAGRGAREPEGPGAFPCESGLSPKAGQVPRADGAAG